MARKRQPSFGDLADAFITAESGLVPDKIGNRSYGNDPASGVTAPKALSGKPQSPAQHAAVVKAARASVAKRKAGVVVKRGLGRGLL